MPQSNTLTARQRRVLSYVRDYSASHGYPPSLDDVATYLHLSRSTAYGHIRVLQRKGRLRRTKKNTSRTLVVVSVAPDLP